MRGLELAVLLIVGAIVGSGAGRILPPRSGNYALISDYVRSQPA